MKIIIHCGLHKTGTTSLQKLLLESYSNPVSGKPYYPIPTKIGPGHANAIHNFANLDTDISDDNINHYLKNALDFGVSHLIISSEIIYTLPISTLDKLIAKLKGDGNEIIYAITLSPYYSRYISCYSEMVKHGWIGSFEESFNNVIQENTLNNELILKFLDFLGESKIFLFINPPNSINTEIGFNFSRYLNLQPDLPKSLTLENNKFSRFEIEFWRLCNICRREDVTHLDYSYLQSDIQTLFRGPKWRQVFKHVPNSRFFLLDEWKAQLVDLANQHFIIFDNYARKYDYTICGDINNLSFIDESL